METGEEEATTKRTVRKWTHDDDDEEDGEEEFDDDDGEEVILRRRALIKGFCCVSISTYKFLGFRLVSLVSMMMKKKFRVALPTSVDDSGGQGETGHGRHGDGYSNIGRRRRRPEPAPSADEADAPPATTSTAAAATLGEDDPAPPTITTREEDHQQQTKWNYLYALGITKCPQHHHQTEPPLTCSLHPLTLFLSPYIKASNNSEPLKNTTIVFSFLLLLLRYISSSLLPSAHPSEVLVRKVDGRLCALRESVRDSGLGPGPTSLVRLSLLPP